MGKAKTEVVDTSVPGVFQNMLSVYAVEEAYEKFWNETNPDSQGTVKVVDIREIQ